MEGGMDDNITLDYAIFQLSPRYNRFEATVFSEGRSEKVSSGHLNELALHLPAIKGFDTDTSDCFKLQPAEELADSSWFRKLTLKVFLNFVNAPEDLKKVNAIQKELYQLEDTRKFHVALYNKDKQTHVGDSATDIGGLKEAESMQRVRVETVSSDATKNELLRALDLRLITLKKDLVETFDQVLRIKCSKGQISNLIAFVGHFGNTDLRNLLLNYLCLKFEDSSTFNEQPELVDPEKRVGNIAEEKFAFISAAGSSSAVKNGISPAKIARAERKSPTESEESSISSDEDGIVAERSRPVIRSASPRRSASPMRRVQIGRSGSRRATAITIKSLNYFPSREKIFLNREADDNDNEGEPYEQQPKKSENTVTRMSVQDRINLFESKQRYQTLDIQKKSSGTDPPLSNTKSVLRRWSSGIGDSSFQCPQETSTDRKCENSSDNLVDSQQKLSEKLDTPTACVKSDDSAVSVSPLESKEVQTSIAGNPEDLAPTQSEEGPDRATASAEWTRQKEAELNRLMEIMEIKTGKFGGMTGVSGGDQELSTDQKGDFYSQYKERRDEKLKKANFARQSKKESKFKGTQDVVGHKNAEMAKKVGVAGKLNPSIQPQKLRRNSLPPVLPSKSNPNVASKKSSPKTAASPTLAKRNSLPLTPSRKAAGTNLTKSSSKALSGTANRKKPASAASPTLPGPHSERSKQPKEAKSLVTDAKTKSKSNEEKKQKVMTKSTKTPKTKSFAPSHDDSVDMPTKPSFYNKVTRKSSVVPLEPKPFLRKGTGSGSGVGPAKTKPPQSNGSPKNSDAPSQAEVNGSIPGTPEKITQPSIPVTVEQPTDGNVNRDYSDAEMDTAKGEASDVPAVQAYDGIIQPAESPEVVIQREEDMGISSAAWVESDPRDMHDFSQDSHTKTVVPGNTVPVTPSSPRVRHSLSQMLQADSTESETIEWGNAENPPALVYQKDAPKGLKRLLKFARKSKGESNVTGWSSPSTFSDGEEDAEESRTVNKKSGDALSRKAISKAKSTVKTSNLLYESFDSANSSKRLNDHSATHDMVSASVSSLPSGNGPVTNPSKGSRSFFSLSTFRSNKSSDTKPR